MDSPETSRTIQEPKDSPEIQSETSSKKITPESKETTPKKTTLQERLEQQNIQLPEGVTPSDLKQGSIMLIGPEDRQFEVYVDDKGNQYRLRKDGPPVPLQGKYFPTETPVDDKDLVETTENGKIIFKDKAGYTVSEIPDIREGATMPPVEPPVAGPAPEEEIDENDKEFPWNDTAQTQAIAEGLKNPDQFRQYLRLARRLDPSIPDLPDTVRTIDDLIDNRDLHGKIWNTVRMAALLEGQGQREAAESMIDIRKLPNFDWLYQKMIDKKVFGDGYVRNPHADNLSALPPKERDAFLRELPNIELDPGMPKVTEDLDLNTIIDGIVGASIGRTYPGADLQVMLTADKQMGLGGELVRKRVEQLMAVEEYDDTKQARQGGFDSIIGAIGQFLTQDSALQQELRVFMFARYKLHETTIMGRYVGVEKMAQQMSNFYQDEFRMIMDVKLFKEAAMMLDSDEGAYFREGRGFGQQDMRELEEIRKSRRYEKDTLQKALLVTPDLSDNDWKGKAFTREQSIEIARRLVERANLTGSFNSDQATLENIAEELAREKPNLKIDLSQKDKLSELFKESLLVKSKFVYEDVAKIFAEKIKLDHDTDKVTPISTVLDTLVAKGGEEGLPRFKNNAEKQRMIDLLSNSFRAFGLSIRTFDIFGRSAEYTGLINKRGEYIRPDAKMSLPRDITWIHLAGNKYFREVLANNVSGIRSEYESLNPGEHFNDLKDSDKQKVIENYIQAHRINGEGPADVKAVLDKYITEWKKNDIDLMNLDQKDGESNEDYAERTAILDVVRDLEGIAVRDAHAKANREFVVAQWNNIDSDITNPFRQGAREYRKAMWNQILLTGLNKDTKGKAFLRRFASTDVISLIQNNGRKSVLDQMAHWNDDFQNMKKHSDALITGAQLRTALTDKEPGLFNSTTKLNDPVEHLRAIKDILVEWTQTHRNEYLDFISSAVLIYLAEYNAADNPGYRNASLMRIMGLAQEMFDGSVMSKGAKGKVEDKLYGSRYWAQTLYTFNKSHKRQAFFGLIKDIFTGATKDLFR